MTPKEKALELTEKFIAPTMDRGLCSYFKSIAISKQCALIAVDEILSQFNWKPSNGSSYWQEVKQEIEKL